MWSNGNSFGNGASVSLGGCLGTGQAMTEPWLFRVLNPALQGGWPVR